VDEGPDFRQILDSGRRFHTAGGVHAERLPRRVRAGRRQSLGYEIP
jgi:hypothetical protein